MRSLAIILFFLTFTSITAQEYNCQIFLKNSSYETVSISSIGELGLIDSVIYYVSFKTVDSLQTNSKALVERILEKHKGYSKLENNQFIVILDKGIYKARKNRISFFKEVSSTVTASSIISNMLSMQVGHKFGFFPVLQQKIIISWGNTFKEPNDLFLGIGYGIGVNYKVLKANMNLWISAVETARYITHSYRTTNKKQLLIFGEYQVFLPLDNLERLQIGLGASYYFSQFIVNDKSPKFGGTVSFRFLL